MAARLRKTNIEFVTDSFRRVYPLFWIILPIGFFACSSGEKTLFEKIDPQQTGIQFKNQLTETENQNILAYEYFYNGGGVATADFNNDGLLDLYFTGNQVPNQLYVNKGNLQFEDITTKAQVGGRTDGWKTGVSLADVNADGWVDIYVCYSGNLPAEKRRNQLFINNHDLTFTEKAAEYGLADEGYSTQAAWLDYDQDGDLDLFLMNHNLRGYQRKEAAEMRAERDEMAGDKLFRNDSPLAPNGGRLFVEVSAQAGIKSNPLGFGLGLVVADLNQDGWLDIYVGNDYVEDDYLYINQRDGTFKDLAKESLAHTSNFTMGVDITDYNNDLAADIITLDMLPEDNARQKKLIFPDNWNVYQAQLANGFHHQNMRNMLQLNEGHSSTARGGDGVPHFAEIGQLAGVSNTDWSWAALFGDWDNDGWKDLFITNGEVRDYTDGDFAKYYADAQMNEQQGAPRKALLEHLKQMPSSKTHFYIFRNKGDLTFENKVTDWGFEEPAVGNGAIYADLDNDGDLDLVTNNNNATAQLYQNHTQDRNPQHWIKVQIKGTPSNPLGIGTKVYVTTSSGQQQYQELTSTRGFQSAMLMPLHFGLGNGTVKKLRVVWPNGHVQEWDKPKENQLIVVSPTQASNANAVDMATPKFWFESTTGVLSFKHIENSEIDFNHQVLLPYLYSYSGARMATGDVNGDGLADVYAGGAQNQAGVLFIQDKKGRFVPTIQPDFDADKASEDRDAVLFDADGDHDHDLYVVSGEYAQPREHVGQADRLYLNDGKGHFSRTATAIPADQHHGSCVKVLDVEKDGDLDLFVGGSVVQNEYPTPEESFLLINDGKAHFTKQSLGAIGLVTDVAILDLDKNGFDDLVVVGEWMQPLLLKNQQGKFTKPTPISQEFGWYNRITVSDLDGDGDLDFVLGNLGNNTPLKASTAEPMTLHYGDLDKNGHIDPIMSYYIQGKPYPAIGRDEALEQVVALRRKYITYEAFGKASLEEMFGEMLTDANVLSINFTETCVLENTSKGFQLHRLPIQAQFAPVYAIVAEDFDHDGKKDLLLAGNQSNYRLRIGKVDANQGVLLRGKGNLQFEYVPQYEAGLWLRGDVKDIKQIGNWLIISQNNSETAVYRMVK
ncbi:MAG: VCBS repeat-containing protein [Spirosomataceae bacterium]